MIKLLAMLNCNTFNRHLGINVVNYEKLIVTLMIINSFLYNMRYIVCNISFLRKLHRHGIIDQQLTCNLITSSTRCHYHTSSWNCIDYTEYDLTQFHYYVKVFSKSGLAVDSNCHGNKNVANAWRRLKRISESRFLKLIYCYGNLLRTRFSKHWNFYLCCMLSRSKYFHLQNTIRITDPSLVLF